MAKNEIDSSARPQMAQIKGYIDKNLKHLIDISDIEDAKKDIKESALLSRGLAAYGLSFYAQISENEAAQSIVDGLGDNGIDAIFWHRNDNILWLVQSKWISKGTGSPEKKDMCNFTCGVRNLIHEKLDRPNNRLMAKLGEVDEALETPGLKVKLLITHTGGDGLSTAARTDISNFISEFNDCDIETYSYEVLDRRTFFKIGVENANNSVISAEFHLSNWGRIEEPYTAYYGCISALELAELWLRHKNRLFDRNLRDFIGQTIVNDGIVRTIKEDPALFPYFNNGVTVLCESIDKKGVSRSQRLSDCFFAKGISVINGAQTIGSISRVYESDQENLQRNMEEAQVFIKLISLEKCPNDFGSRVTKATNTQNTVENSDFIALDPNQQRLAQELKAWDKDKTYYYKRSIDAISSDQGCTLEEASIALACYHPDVRLAVIAKRDVAELWADNLKDQYQKIFNQAVSAIHLWRTVEVYRQVIKTLSSSDKDDAVLKKLLTSGDLFILHLVFQALKKKVDIFNPEFTTKDHLLFIPQTLDRQVDIFFSVMSKQQIPTRLGAFFKLEAKCQALKQEIEQIAV